MTGVASHHHLTGHMWIQQDWHPKAIIKWITGICQLSMCSTTSIITCYIQYQLTSSLTIHSWITMISFKVHMMYTSLTMVTYWCMTMATCDPKQKGVNTQDASSMQLITLQNNCKLFGNIILVTYVRIPGHAADLVMAIQWLGTSIAYLVDQVGNKVGIIDVITNMNWLIK